jgi:hypothetical protein
MAHLLSDVAAVKLDNATGVLTVISGSVNSVSVDGGNASIQDTGIGDARHTEANDLKPVQTMTLSGFIDTTSAAIIGPLINGTSVMKSVEVQTLSGSYLSTNSARVGTVSRSIPVGLQTWSLELRSAASEGFNHTSVALS